jgi:type IV pilus assembly protein PilW
MTSRRLQAGLSLVELMVSVTLGLMILSGVLVVFVNTSAARNEVERTTRQIENGRYASELLSEDFSSPGSTAS